MTNKDFLLSSNERDNEYIALSIGIGIQEAALLPLEHIPIKIGASASQKIYSSCNKLPPVLIKYVDDIASRFDWRSYKDCNRDLGQMKPSDLVDHFLEYGITDWRRHWRYNSNLMDRRYAVAFHSSADVHLRLNMQAVVHCYHYDVLCYLAPYLRHIARLGGDIHLLVVNDNLLDSALDDYLSSLNTGFTRHSWIRVPNYGEDWSSFHHAFRLGLFNHEGVTFKIQTKRSSSLGSDGGSVWIDDALGPLCASSSSIVRTLSSLSDNNGSIVSSTYVRCKEFGANPRLVSEYIEKMNLGDSSKYKMTYFAGGSMFAATNKIIRGFYERLGDVDYSKIVDGGNSYCGRFAGHALERVFFYYATQHSAAANSIVWAS